MWSANFTCELHFLLFACLLCYIGTTTACEIPANGAKGKWWTATSDNGAKILKSGMGAYSTKVISACVALCRAQNRNGVCAFKDGWGGECSFSAGGAVQDYDARYGHADTRHYAALCTTSTLVNKGGSYGFVQGAKVWRGFRLDSR